MGRGLGLEMKGRDEMICHKCQSTEIEEGIAIGQSAEVGNIGPRSRKGPFGYVSQMYCNLCLDCGEIISLYIKDDTDRKWVKKPGSLGTK